MTATTTIEHMVEIDASPSTVYELWTTAVGLCAWWGVSASIDPKPGGAVRVDIDGEHVMVGEVLSVEPHDLGAGSRVTLRHYGLPIEFIESHAGGWTYFLDERLGETAR